MSENKVKTYRFQAAIPTVLRYLGLLGGVAVVFAIGLGFYFSAAHEEFRGKDFPAELSGNVIGVINGYKRNETENGVLKYFIEADEAKTFDDNHQELKNVKLQLFKNGERDVFDRIAADKAVYLPVEGSKDFRIFFAGNVDIETNNNLNVKTDQLNYNSLNNIALAEESVSFRRFNISGTSIGATVNIGKKTLLLHRDVDILMAGESPAGEPKIDVQQAKLRSGTAFVDGENEKIRLTDGVDLDIAPRAGSSLKQPTNIKSSTANIFLADRAIKKIELDGSVKVKQEATKAQPAWMETSSKSAVAYVEGELKRLELFNNVSIRTNRGGGSPVEIISDSAFYTRADELFELNGRVDIRTVRDSQKLKATGSRGTYKQRAGEVRLEGAAEIVQGSDVIKGDKILGKLSSQNQLVYATANGNAYLNQNSGSRKTAVNSDTLSAWFSAQQTLSKAEARGRTTIEAVPNDKQQFSVFKMSTPKGLDLGFNNNGSISEMIALGRTTLYLDAGSGGSSRSDKTLTADKIKSVFRSNGNELLSAYAAGDAELLVVPRESSDEEYKTVIQSPRFDCDFFAGNNARKCTSVARSRVTRTSMKGNKPVQNLQANKLISAFDQKTREITVFEAIGKATFSEDDRNGKSERIVYKPNDDSVRLTGSGPTIWDSRARAKADSIDWNTREDKSVLDGNVSTTYYNQKQTGGAAPFSNANSPVFLTASRATFDHDEKIAVYTGNARAWQAKNYIRGDKIVLEETDGRFFAEGKVQSVLYDASRTIGGRKSSLPVFVSAGTMQYQRGDRHLRYENDVDIRQGTDRIESKTADVYLNPDNSLSKTVARGNVVITQPRRKATGDYAQYDAASEEVELTGNPATFSDQDSGATTGRIVTVNLKTRTAVNSGSETRNGTGRIRSVYKVKGGRIN